MKDILIKIVESDKAMVILVVGCLGGGLIIKLADPTNAVTPIVTGLFGIVTGVAMTKAAI